MKFLIKCFEYIKDLIKKFWNWIVDDPKYIIRYVILFACSLIVTFQLSQSFYKLSNPPITTHAYYDINATMSYPALTFCREPPYNKDVLNEYNLSFHPQFQPPWKDFPFGSATLTEVFDKATYNSTEVFQHIMHNGIPGTNVNVRSSLHFFKGLCHTVIPLQETVRVWRDVGYVIRLQHDIKSTDEEAYGEKIGWHLFIHDKSEPFSENRMQSSGRVEYIFIDSGEDVEMKLTVQDFATVPSKNFNCSQDSDYSSIKCGEDCRWQYIIEDLTCKGPWMTILDYPECDNSNDMTKLIRNYNKWTNYDDYECNCQEPCRTKLYSAYIIKRKPLIESEPLTHIDLYYTSKMVSSVEERFGYDISQFISDMGGSLGFLLGLSVLGVIGILEKMAKLVLSRFRTQNKSEEENNENCTKINNTLKNNEIICEKQINNIKN